MQKTVWLLVLGIIAFTPTTVATAPVTPQVPNTSIVAGPLSSAIALFPEAADVLNIRTRADRSPVALSVPTISLEAPVQNMGVLENGELDVPEGDTDNVGWYAKGTLPGQLGSAVLDAHVFAAFKNLDKLRVGDDIYVTAQDGVVSHYRVEETKTYKLGALSSDLLFNRADAKRLNLITCAGELTDDRSTYTHRLVVFAVLVE